MKHGLLIHCYERYRLMSPRISKRDSVVSRRQTFTETNISHLYIQQCLSWKQSFVLTDQISLRWVRTLLRNVRVGMLG
ncbi:hypothetical protein PV326_002001 [Microctonus aethiopoides]|nr:hypothetical protein PV326_002001 [Microctonus aethiopoides]